MGAACADCDSSRAPVTADTARPNVLNADFPLFDRVLLWSRRDLVGWLFISKTVSLPVVPQCSRGVKQWLKAGLAGEKRDSWGVNMGIFPRYHYFIAMHALYSVFFSRFNEETRNSPMKSIAKCLGFTMSYRGFQIACSESEILLSFNPRAERLCQKEFCGRGHFRTFALAEAVIPFRRCS